jgi:hypothetical protein
MVIDADSKHNAHGFTNRHANCATISAALAKAAGRRDGGELFVGDIWAIKSASDTCNADFPARCIAHAVLVLHRGTRLQSQPDRCPR